MKINICGISFDLSADNRAVLKIIEKFLFPFSVDTHATNHSIDIREKQLLLDNKPVDNDLPVYAPLLVVEQLLNTINNVLYQEVKDYLLIHGGVAEKDGAVFIFTGDSGAGKSTMMARLFLRGWRIMSDHLAPVSLQNGRVYPFPIPMKLKSPPTEIVEELQKNHTITLDCYRRGKRSLYYVNWNRRAGNTGLNPTAIFFLNREVNDDSGCCFRHLSQKDLLAMLIPQCTNLFHQDREAYHFLLKTIIDIPASELIYQGLDGLDTMAEMLEEYSI